MSYLVHRRRRQALPIRQLPSESALPHIFMSRADRYA